MLGPHIYIDGLSTHRKHRHRGDTHMTNEARVALAAIRKRDKAVGRVATRSEAVAALNDCRTLLAIIHDSQIDELERRPAA
jgi:hypothetical protein